MQGKRLVDMDHEERLPAQNVMACATRCASASASTQAAMQVARMTSGPTRSSRPKQSRGCAACYSGRRRHRVQQ
eukprot:5256130-Prymnesium_polylepis.1